MTRVTGLSLSRQGQHAPVVPAGRWEKHSHPLSVSHANSAGRQEEIASLREKGIWKSYTAGTVCIHLQLVTWDLENICFATPATQSDFIFKRLFFPPRFPLIKEQNCSQPK